MSLGEAALTFLSVFVAALLAFYLDGLRERRATARWVSEYLGFWRGMLESTSADGEASESGVRRIELALNAWLAAGPSSHPSWADLDALKVDAAVRFTPPLLNSGGRALPVELMQRLFTADAYAPVLSLRSEFVTRLFELEVRPLVLTETVPLEGRDRRAVELYKREFLGLFEQMRTYSELMKGIRSDLVRLGF